MVHKENEGVSEMYRDLCLGEPKSGGATGKDEVEKGKEWKLTDRKGQNDVKKREKAHFEMQRGKERNGYRE